MDYRLLLVLWVNGHWVTHLASSHCRGSARGSWDGAWRVHSLSDGGCACGQPEPVSQKRATPQLSAWLTLSGLYNKQGELKEQTAICRAGSKQGRQRLKEKVSGVIQNQVSRHPGVRGVPILGMPGCTKPHRALNIQCFYHSVPYVCIFLF